MVQPAGLQGFVDTAVPRLYRPRCVAALYVPDLGEPAARVAQEGTDAVTRLVVNVRRVRIESNNHNEADECELSILYDDAGIDPRVLKSAEAYVYLGMADDRGNFQPGPDNLRFIGIATDVERTLSEGGGKEIRIRFLDYTTLFLTARQFPAEGIPLFTDGLVQAWRRICDHTGYYDWSSGFNNPQVVSTVARLRDRIEFTDESLQHLRLGDAVSPRLAKLGKLQVKQHADAWSVWQTAVGSLGLISYIRGDRCIVTTATDYYTSDDPPRFIWGKNVKELRENRDANALSGKNVGLFCFDPLLRRTIEAYWPPLENVKTTSPRQKKSAASALGPGVTVRAQDYEIFDYDGCVTDAKFLQEIARRVWEERSRQELVGDMKTVVMLTETYNGNVFDVLAIQSGDRVRIEIDRPALTQIMKLDDLGSRVEALQQREYSDDMAVFIAENLDAIARMPPEFQVHSSTTSLEIDVGGGRYETNIRFINRITPSGAALPNTDAPAQTSGPPAFSGTNRLSRKNPGA